MRTETRTPPARETRPRAVVTPPHHRQADVAGVLSLAFALILALALGLGNAGLLGDALSNFFSLLFGRGAWAVAGVAALFGVALLAGRNGISLTRSAWGAGLIFLASVGLFAQDLRGDYFDPEMAAASGGYLGAIVGWSLGTLLGSAKAIGIGALGMVGLILIADAPLRTLAERLGDRVRKPRSLARVRGRDGDGVSAGGNGRKAALRDAVVRMANVETGQTTLAETSATPPAAVLPRTRPAPVMRETISLATESLDSRPKEGYTLPGLGLLREPTPRPKRSAEEMQRNIETLEGTLEQFNIEANVVEIATGPTITRYEIQLGPGIRVARITALADNIAMNLAASHVRVEAPIPGKAAIGVEVPNGQPSMVSLRELCETKEFQEHPSRLCVALGQDVSGVNKYADLTRMPHLLIGGATNSGKSIGLATIITSLLMRNTPKDLRMVMVDPKRVELSLFDGVPHLMCPVVKDVKEAPGVLRAVWREMDRRYDLLSERGVRNIDGWNAKASFAEKLPYIVVVIDELADLMIQAAAEVETSIVRLAQLARAVGIHLVIATQRPSVDVITGTIKANIPSRIAFSVSSQIDSRTILDQAGAERLVGKGDMLFLPIDASKPLRVQGCYVSEAEIESVCQFWRAQEAPQYVLNPIQTAIAAREAEMSEQESDPLWEEAVQWVVDRKQASTSMIQRRFSIGFQRASRLLDLMEERNIVGPRDGPRPREVLIDPSEVEAYIKHRTPPQFVDPHLDDGPLGDD